MIASASAKRYAKAILAIAKERDQLTQWTEELDRIVSIMKDGNVAQLLSSVRVRVNDKVRLLETLLTDLSPLAKNLAHLLLRKNKLNEISHIAEEYRKLIDIEKGIEHAEVVAAVPLTGEEQQRIKEWLLSITGKSVILHIVVNPDVLGGLVVRMGGKLIDASARNKLTEMRKSLAGARA